ncbi:MAG: threonine-phosphate decarboxylase CobD [Methyloceanibacter sp.]
MSSAFIAPPSELAPLAHGGDLAAARGLFPGAPEPFLDLSTGINPNPYPVPALAPDLWTKLPEPEGVSRLTALAAKAYGAPSAAYVVVAPGTQMLMALAVGFVPPGRAAILEPTYAEHARLARLAGHQVAETSNIEALGEADLAIVVNPNNPDGRIVAKGDLLAIAERLRPRGGLLVVDEAFMDAGPDGLSLGEAVERGNIVVLRSFGKFFGLPGLRLGFALTSPAIAARFAVSLGPWPVSGAALVIGTAALADSAWREKARVSLAKAASRLDASLTDAELEIIGGTPLFRLVRSPPASKLFQHLGRAGIFTRRFSDEPSWLRFGLPGAEPEWQRLKAALAAFR